MKDYKRLTKNSGWHKDIDLTQELGYSYIYQRLSELENKIENGTLVELPCKIGDTLWEVYKSYIAPLDFIVDAIKIWDDGDISIEDRYNNHYFISDFGKTVFLTKAEAEKKLKELQEK